LTYEEIDIEFNKITPYALYVAIITGLNLRMDYDKMDRVGRHPIKTFVEFTDQDAEHYKYVRTTINNDIKRINKNIGRIKTPDKYIAQSHEISNTGIGYRIQSYKRTYASFKEICIRFISTGKIQPYWHHYK